MTARGDFPTLGQLVAGGFVEGYEEYFGTAEEIVSARAHNPVTGPRLVDEITRVLLLPDDDVAAVLAELGNGYAYDAYGLSSTRWLEQVRAQVIVEMPESDPRFSGLVGQHVEGVSGGLAVNVTLERATVVFPTGVSCKGPGGVGPVAPDADLSLVAEAVGETVVAVSESRGQLTIATQRVRMYSLPAEDGPLYVVEERSSR